MTQAQCHKTITNLSANDDCKWIVDKCYAISSFASGACTSFKGTQTMCIGYRVGCTNVNSATSSTACTLDCTLKTGTGLTFQDCQALDTTCSVNSTGTGCIAIQSACTGYGSTATNCFRSTAGLCAMNAASPATCQAVTQASECVFVAGLTGLDHAKCQAYHTSCTSLNDGTGCQEFKATCPAFTGDAAHCTYSQQGKCYLSGTDCVRFSTCSAISGTGLTDAKCAGYNADCTVNAAGTACQEQKATCSLNLTQDSCTTSKDTAPADKCAWSGTACVAVTTVATQCAFVTGSGLDDTQCGGYNAGCVANSTGTACQEKKATCAGYTSITACATSGAGKCYWNAAATPAVCISIATASSDCQLVLGTGLDDTKCGAYLTDCVANSTGAACQQKQATCAGYTSTTACATSGAGKCYWNAAATPPACISIATASSDCQLVLGTGLDYTKCGAYLADCVPNPTGTACAQKQATCGGYTSSISCGTSTAGKCYWNAAATPAVCISIATASSDCQLVLGTGLDDTKCGAYLTDCVANSTGAACQQIQATCAGYTSSTACATSTAGKCYWNAAATPAVCISIATASSDCQLVLGTGLNDSKCSVYNAGCTSLVDGIVILLFLNI